MTEISNLTTLREKLVSRRRKIATSFEEETGDRLTGDAFRRVQDAIDAIDRAVADEQRLALSEAIGLPDASPARAAAG
jgi:hypothetical protein